MHLKSTCYRRKLKHSFFENEQFSTQNHEIEAHSFFANEPFSTKIGDIEAYFFEMSLFFWGGTYFFDEKNIQNIVFRLKHARRLQLQSLANRPSKLTI